MRDADIKTLLDARISRARAKELLIELVKVPSPQTELLEDEPLLKAFIKTAIEPRLLAMGFADIRYDAMGNLIAAYGAGTSGKSLMFIGNAMNQPASTMPNPYAGDVVDGESYGLPGECVLGKGASEQKANLAGMLHAMETVIASKAAIAGKLVFTCCVSGETGKHDAIKSVVEGAGVRADMAVLGGTGLKVTLGNRGRIDVFVTVKGSPCHSSRPWDGVNAITGATEAIRALLAKVKLDKSSSAARQAVADGQSHPQLSGFDPHGAGPLRVHARPPPAAGRGPERGLRRDRAHRQGGRADRGSRQRKGLRDRRAARAVHVSVIGDGGVADRAGDPARERGDAGQAGRDLLLAGRLRPGLPQPCRHRDRELRRRRAPVRPHR